MSKGSGGARSSKTSQTTTASSKAPNEAVTSFVSNVIQEKTFKYSEAANAAKNASAADVKYVRNELNSIQGGINKYNMEIDALSKAQDEYVVKFHQATDYSVRQKYSDAIDYNADLKNQLNISINHLSQQKATLEGWLKMAKKK